MVLFQSWIIPVGASYKLDTSFTVSRRYRFQWRTLVLENISPLNQSLDSVRYFLVRRPSLRNASVRTKRKTDAVGNRTDLR